MAIPKGVFDSGFPLKAIFDPEIQASGWFDSDFGDDAAAGGTTFTSTLTGTITPAGVLLKLDAKQVVGTLTPSSALAKLVSKTLTGAITPIGALLKQAQKALAGTITPAGTIVKLVLKALTGSITPSGVLTSIRVLLRTLTGSITPSGTLVKQAQKSLLGSISPASALAKLTSKALTGVVTPASSLLKLVAKKFTGSITPSSVLTTIKLVVRFLTGSITPSGVLLRQSQKGLTASITPIGVLRRSISKALTGVLVPVSALQKTVSKFIAGVIALIGTLARQTGVINALPSTGYTSFTVAGFVHTQSLILRYFEAVNEAFASVAIGYAAAVLSTSGLKGYWRLAELTGTDAADSSGLGHPGVYSGGYTLGATGAIADGNTSVTMNGLTGKVTTTLPASGFGTGGATLEAWFKTTANPVRQYIADNKDGATNSGGLSLATGATGNVVAKVANGSNGLTLQAFTLSYSDDVWHHAAIVFRRLYDGIHDGAFLYVDAVERSQADAPVGWDITPVSPLTIGISSALQQPFAGSIDEVAIYDQALTAAQVAEHYAERLEPSTLRVYDPANVLRTAPISGGGVFDPTLFDPTVFDTGSLVDYSAPIAGFSNTVVFAGV